MIELKSIGGFAGNISLSPTGQAVALQVRSADIAGRTYRTEWYVVSTRAPFKAVRVADGGEFLLNKISFGRSNGEPEELKAKWSPDEQWIAYRRLTAGIPQLWRARSDGTGEQQLTFGTLEVIDFQWSNRWARLRVTFGRDLKHNRAADNEEGDSGFLLDDRFLPDYSSAPLWFKCTPSSWQEPVPASQTCTPVARILDLSSTAQAPRLTEAIGVDALEFEPAARRSAIGDGNRKLLTFDRNRRHVAWAEPTDAGASNAADLLAVTADSKRCRHVACTGSILGVWWAGPEVVFLKREGRVGERTAIYAWLPTTNRLRAVYRSDDSVLNACDARNGTMACLEEGLQQPRRVVRIGITEASVDVIFDPNPSFAGFFKYKIEKLEWFDGFGIPTFAHLVYPADYSAGRRYPLVVVQYRSRGFLNGGSGDEYPIFPLASNGFFVLSFDRPEDKALAARHDINSMEGLGGLVAEQWKDGYIHKEAVSALEIILSKLEARGLLDPDRVGITGLSNGAETVDWALFNSRWFSAAAHSGMWSPTAYYLTTNESLREFIKRGWSASSGEEVMKAWQPLSITNNAAKVTAPLLIQVSDRELITSTPTVVALRDAGKAVEAYVFPNEDHVKWQPQHKLAIANRTIDWFRFWLQGYEDPSSAKSGQYERWRRLKVTACGGAQSESRMAFCDPSFHGS